MMNGTLRLMLGIMILASLLVFTFFYPLTKGEGEPSFSASATKSTFINQDIQHDIPLTITVSDMPSDLSIRRLSCSVGGGLVSCRARATECKQDGSVFSCILTISPINYTSPSARDVYDPSSKTITLSGNSVTLQYSSSEGSGKATLPLADITITVIPVCGKNGCERQAGESASTCCIDCPCPAGQYCYTGDRPSGECVYVAQKEFYVTGFDPSTATAIPFFGGQQWHFTTKMEAILKFNVGKPFTLSSVWYRVDEKDYKLDCTQPENDEVTCSLALPPIKSTQSPPTRDIEFFALIAYTEDGIDHSQTVLTEAKVPISYETPPVEGCKEKLHLLNKNRVEVLENYVKSIHDLCELWDKEDTQYKLELAVEKCCKDILNPQKCLCSQEEYVTLEKHAGQHHSCYLCAHPCLCDTLPHFDALVSGYQSYRGHLEAVCSATDFAAMSSALSAMREDVSGVEAAMNSIKEACKPVTKKSTWCQKEDFPDCTLESGLEEHGDINFEIVSKPLSNSQ